ncbi:glycerate kinase [uncultured Corynebacterium sp.]|uniref:glycerate kinase family protein n=1 Tax=uncultured Corynebacterium sp. TaxID=159447 RepID=UPI0025E56B6E|nr:glycerate kinase [uncultured Corynebacterium sp.]
MTMFIPQRVLVAPSGFKESLSAVEAADAIAGGIRRELPGVRVDIFPVADGGEGTVDIVVARTGATRRTTRVTGPVGRPVFADWAIVDDGSGGRTAVVEMASAGGLRLVPEDLRDPGATSTRGVGELIVAALDEGVDRIVVGCGDSGTCDGGAGALSALGARILDRDGAVLDDGGGHLVDAVSIDASGLHPGLASTPITLACNMHNVLTGPRGVARVFGPQKGASPQRVEELDAAMANWARLLEWAFAPPVDVARGPGSGASGGLGAGLAAIGAVPRSRFDVLLDGDAASGGLGGADIDALIDAADLVITAEGAIDFQTPNGKVPAEIARRAQRGGAPVLALAGSLGRGAPQVHDCGIGAIASIMTVPMALEDAVRDGRSLLADAAARSIRLLLLGAAVASRSEDRFRAGLAS